MAACGLGPSMALTTLSPTAGVKGGGGGGGSSIGAPRLVTGAAIVLAAIVWRAGWIEEVMMESNRSVSGPNGRKKNAEEVLLTLEHNPKPHEPYLSQIQTCLTPQSTHVHMLQSFFPSKIGCLQKFYRPGVGLYGFVHETQLSGKRPEGCMDVSEKLRPD
jgi:hypothetical protein